MIKSTLVTPFALLTFILALSGCQNAPAEAPETFVAVVKVAYAAETDGLDEWTELTGATQPPSGRAARITAPFEGRVQSILISDEEARKQVKKDQGIVQLENSLATFNESKANAALEEHKQLLEQAKLAVDLAELEVKRLKNLDRDDRPVTGAITNIQLTNPIEKERARLSLLDAQSKQVALVEREKSLKVDLTTASLQLKRHTVCAPIAGYLGPVQVVPGQTVATGTVIADIVDLSDMDVVAYVSPHTVGKLQYHQKARVVVEGKKVPASNLPEGEVIFIAMQAHPDTGNFLVKVRFPNKDLQALSFFGASIAGGTGSPLAVGPFLAASAFISNRPALPLKANQIVNVQVQTKEPKKRLTIPESAVMEDQDPSRVVIAVEGRDEKGDQTHKARILTAKLGVCGTVSHPEGPMRVVEILELEDSQHQKVPVQGAHIIMEGGHGLNENDLIHIED